MSPMTHAFLCLNSVADPFHFATDPDHRIRFVETRIRIRPKREEIPTLFITFFSADYPENDLLGHKY